MTHGFHFERARRRLEVTLWASQIDMPLMPSAQAYESGQTCRVKQDGIAHESRKELGVPEFALDTVRASHKGVISVR